jgi:hypothetical protein
MKGIAAMGNGGLLYAGGRAPSASPWIVYEDQELIVLS